MFVTENSFMRSTLARWIQTKAVAIRADCQVLPTFLKLVDNILRSEINLSLVNHNYDTQNSNAGIC